MRFLEENELWEWCRDHGVALVNDGPDDKGRIKLASDPTLVRAKRIIYAESGRSGREAAIAGSMVVELERWDDCIVWITLWGVWPSSEDWPQFYGWRGAKSERRSLDTAPGHRFELADAPQLTELLTMILENAWDATLLLALGGQVVPKRIVVSHDGFIDICERSAAS